MGKASDRVKRPFAPLERDVDPPLRKLAFVRARCVSSRDALDSRRARPGAASAFERAHSAPTLADPATIRLASPPRRPLSLALPRSRASDPRVFPAPVPALSPPPRSTSQAPRPPPHLRERDEEDARPRGRRRRRRRRSRRRSRRSRRRLGRTRRRLGPARLGRATLDALGGLLPRPALPPRGDHDALARGAEGWRRPRESGQHVLHELRHAVFDAHAPARGVRARGRAQAPPPANQLPERRVLRRVIRDGRARLQSSARGLGGPRGGAGDLREEPSLGE